MVALCVLTGRDWSTTARAPRPDPAHLRRRAAVTLGLVYGQVVAGAWLRHFGSIAALVVHARAGGGRLGPRGGSGLAGRAAPGRGPRAGAVGPCPGAWRSRLQVAPRGRPPGGCSGRSMEPAQAGDDLPRR